MIILLIAMLIMGLVGLRVARIQPRRWRVALWVQAAANILLSTGLLAYAFMA